MKIRKSRELVIVGSVAITLLWSSTTPTLAQSPQGGFAHVINAARAHPGCLGVETGQTSSGKRIIFAWFENKKAVLNWYYSDTHQGAIKQFFPQFQQAPKRTPLADVPDEGPVMAIASLTLADKPPADTTTLPVSQIAIELYRPLPGGIALGGRFAPATLKVPGMRELRLTKEERDQ